MRGSEDPTAEAVRLAGPEEAASVAGLLAGFRAHYGETEPALESIEAGVERLLDSGEAEFLLAGQPAVGVAALRFRFCLWTGADDAWLEDLYVAEDARGRGTGRALLGACVGRATERGCARLQLDTNEADGAAIGLYESAGFLASKRGRGGGRDLYLTRWL